MGNLIHFLIWVWTVGLFGEIVILVIFVHLGLGFVVVFVCVCVKKGEGHPTGKTMDAEAKELLREWLIRTLEPLYVPLLLFIDT